MHPSAVDDDTWCLLQLEHPRRAHHTRFLPLHFHTPTRRVSLWTLARSRRYKRRPTSLVWLNSRLPLFASTLKQTVYLQYMRFFFARQLLFFFFIDEKINCNWCKKKTLTHAVQKSKLSVGRYWWLLCAPIQRETCKVHAHFEKADTFTSAIYARAPAPQKLVYQLLIFFPLSRSYIYRFGARCAANEVHVKYEIHFGIIYVRVTRFWKATTYFNCIIIHHREKEI